MSEIYITDYGMTLSKKNELQYSILAKIYKANKSISLMFVGDVNQAIYGSLGGITKCKAELVRHKVILNLGRLDQIKGNPSFQRLAIRFQELSGVKNRVDLNTFSEAQIVNWGYLVYKKIWKEFDLDNILTQIKTSRRTQFDLNNTCFLMVIFLIYQGFMVGLLSKSGERYSRTSEQEIVIHYRDIGVIGAFAEEAEKIAEQRQRQTA